MPKSMYRAVGSTEYVGDRKVRSRLMPGGLRTGAAREYNRVYLLDIHADVSNSPTVLGRVVGDFELKGDEFWAEMELNETSENADYIRAVDNGFRGTSFSVGFMSYKEEKRGRASDGALLIDVLDYEFYEVVDAPVPMDPKGIQRAISDDLDPEELFDFGPYKLYTGHSTTNLIRRAINGTLEDEPQTEIATEVAEMDESTATVEAVEQAPAAASVPAQESKMDSDLLARYEARMADLERRAVAAEQRAASDEFRATLMETAVEAYGEAQAKAEVDKAIANGETEAAFTKRAMRAKVESVQINSKPMQTMARGGLNDTHEFGLGSYINAISRRALHLPDEAGYGVEYEIAEAASQLKSVNEDGNGIVIPGAVLRSRRTMNSLKETHGISGRRAIINTDVANVTERFIDREDFAGWFVDMLPWLEMCTVRTGLVNREFVLPAPNLTDAPSAAAIDAQNSTPVAVSESSPSLTPQVRRPITIASYFQFPKSTLISSYDGLDMLFEREFAKFAREELGNQLLNGVAATAGNMDGLYRTALITNSATVAATPTKANFMGVLATLIADKANGMGEGWVVSTDLRTSMSSTPLESGWPKYFFEMTDLYRGTAWQSGEVYVSPILSHATDNDIGIYGFWGHFIVAMWGDSLELVVFDPPSKAVREFGIRLYANSGVANANAFCKVKRA